MVIRGQGGRELKVKSFMRKKRHRGIIGKLITERGPISGYLSAYGTVWGKLKLLGDEAERAMGFRPKEGAIGVLLSRRKYIDKNGKEKKGIFATSLMPTNPVLTDKLKVSHDRMSVVTRIAKEHMKDLIHPIWDPLVSKRKSYTGVHYFVGMNTKRLGNPIKWERLIISDGEVEPPRQVVRNWYDPDTNEIRICMPKIRWHLGYDIRIGIGLLDIITGSFFHIAPEKREEGREKREEGKIKRIWRLEKIRRYYKPHGTREFSCCSRFYIYVYYQQGIDSDKNRSPTGGEGIRYSPSISSRVLTLRCRRSKYKCNPIRIKVIE